MYGLELVGREGNRVADDFCCTWHRVSSSGRCPCFISGARRAPLLNLDCSRSRRSASPSAGGSLFRISISVSPFLLPLMFQVGFGLDAFQSGLLMLGLFAGNLGMKSITTPVLRRFGFRPVLIVNGMLTAVLMLACGTLFPQTSRAGNHLHFIFKRIVPLDAVHEPEFAGLRRCEQAGFGLCHQLFQHVDTDDHGNGRCGGRNRVAIGGLVTGNTSGTPTTKEFHIAFVFVAALVILGTLDCFGSQTRCGSGRQRAWVGRDSRKKLGGH